MKSPKNKRYCCSNRLKIILAEKKPVVPAIVKLPQPTSAVAGASVKFTLELENIGDYTGTDQYFLKCGWSSERFCHAEGNRSSRIGCSAGLCCFINLWVGVSNPMVLYSYISGLFSGTLLSIFETVSPTSNCFYFSCLVQGC